MIEVAIIAGGPSAERGISLKSAATIAKHLPADKYHSTIIDAMPEGWKDLATGHLVDLNRFVLQDEKGNTIRKFDFAFLFIHGSPVEDGKMQGYFEMMGIPHSACGVLSSSLTFNKQMCKNYVTPFGIPVAESMVVTKVASAVDAQQHGITLPCFVKPNNNGSSYGVSKVKSWDQLERAIHLALEYDHEVMIERGLNGVEYSNGVVQEGERLHVLPVTEIIPQGEFFDYAAKYEGASQEITPARLNPELTQQCQQRSKLLYQILQCRGMVRFDYILENGTFYFLEANTTPGLSEASIIPQQAIAYGWTIGQMLDIVVSDSMKQRPVLK
jgi:D-alanine-D-alanine ligase